MLIDYSPCASVPFMSTFAVRKYRDKLLFALAYGAVAALILFAHPFGGTPNTEIAPAKISAR